MASTGEYISFLDDDDVRLPGSIDVQMNLLQARPDAGFVYGRASIGDDECRPSGNFYPQTCPQGDIFWELLTQNFIPCGSAVFRRSAVVSLGLLDDTIPGLDDWDLWIRLSLAGAEFVAVPQVAAYYRQTPGSMSTNHERMLASASGLIPAQSVGRATNGSWAKSQPGAIPARSSDGIRS